MISFQRAAQDKFLYKKICVSRLCTSEMIFRGFSKAFSFQYSEFLILYEMHKIKQSTSEERVNNNGFIY